MTPIEPNSTVQNPHAIRALYDSVAVRYDEIAAAAGYVGPHWLERALDAIAPPARAVDFGCANGILGRILRRRFPGTNLVGVDVSVAMLREAARAASYDELRGHDLDQPVTWLGTASIELVVALGFSEFLRDPRVFVGEAARVLVGGGSLLMSFQEFRPQQKQLAPRRVNTGDVTHTAYTTQEVRDLLRAAGLCVQYVESVQGYVAGSGFCCPYAMVHALRAQ